MRRRGWASASTRQIGPASGLGMDEHLPTFLHYVVFSNLFLLDVYEIVIVIVYYVLVSVIDILLLKNDGLSPWLGRASV